MDVVKADRKVDVRDEEIEAERMDLITSYYYQLKRKDRGVCRRGRTTLAHC